MRVTLLWLSVIFALDQAMYSTITPLLPGLQAEFQLTGTEVGLLVGAYPLGLVFAAVPAGQLATRWGAKPMVVAGAVLLGLASLGFGFAPSFYILVAMRMLQGVSAALTWAGGLGWASALAGAGREGVLIGSVLSATVVGTVIGPSLGVIAVHTGLGPAFTAIAAASFVCGAALARRTIPAMAAVSRLREVISALFKPSVAPLTWCNVLCALMVGALMVLTPMLLNRLGVSATWIGILFAGIAVLEVIIAPLLGGLHDRHGARLPLTLCMIIGAAALVGLAFVSNGYVAAALTALVLPATALMLTPALAGVSSYGSSLGLSAPSLFGVTNFLWALGESVGALLAGASTGFSTTFANLGLAAVLALSIIPVMTLKSRVAKPASPALEDENSDT